MLFWKDFAGRFWGSDEGKSIDLEELVKLNEASYEDGTPMSPSKFALVLFYFMNSRVQFKCYLAFMYLLFVCLCKLYTLTYKLLSPLFIVINRANF